MLHNHLRGSLKIRSGLTSGRHPVLHTLALRAAVVNTEHADGVVVRMALAP